MSESISTEQKTAIGGFKAKAKMFWQLWTKLDGQQDIVARQSPYMQGEYKDLMERGTSIRNKIEWTTGLIDKAASAYSSVKDWISSQFNGVDDDQGMGIIPIIPIAIIAASISAMGYWISDAYKFSKKLAEIQRLENRGLTSEKAAEVVERTLASKGFFSGSGKMLFPILLGIGVFIMIKKGQ